MESLPSNHYFLGSIQWSPQLDIDSEILDQLEEPYIYATLGSSGRNEIFDTMVDGLSQIGCKVFLSTADNYLSKVNRNIISRIYLPGALMAKNALMIVSNGGSTTGYQSLFEGKPVLGIATNLDQYLCMQNLTRLGVGRLIRARSLKSSILKN